MDFFKVHILWLHLHKILEHQNTLYDSRGSMLVKRRGGGEVSSVTQSCLTLSEPMDCSMPSCLSPLPVHHQLPEITETHVHWASDAIHLLLCRPFSSHIQSFPASGSLQISQFFARSGKSIGDSTSVSVFPMNIQDWFLLGLAGWIFLLSNGLSRVVSQHHSSKALILQLSVVFKVQLSHPYMTTGKTIALTRRTFVDSNVPAF